MWHVFMFGWQGSPAANCELWILRGANKGRGSSALSYTRKRRRKEKKKSKLTQEAHADKKNEGATALHYPPQSKANPVYKKTNLSFPCFHNTFGCYFFFRETLNERDTSRHVLSPNVHSGWCFRGFIRLERLEIAGTCKPCVSPPGLKSLHHRASEWGTGDLTQIVDMRWAGDENSWMETLWGKSLVLKVCS